MSNYKRDRDGRLEMGPFRDIIGYARQLIKNGWCIGACARDKELNKVDIWDDSAKYFCLFGAINRAAIELGFCTKTDCTLPMEITKQICRSNDIECFPMFNDNCATKQPILDLLDKEIAKLDKEILNAASEVSST